MFYSEKLFYKKIDCKKIPAKKINSVAGKIISSGYYLATINLIIE